MNIDPNAVSRLKRAWLSFSSKADFNEVRALEQKIDRAHEQAKSLFARGTGKVDHPELAWARTLLGSKDELEASNWSSIVDAEGALWGTKKFEQLDPGWAEALIDYLEYKDKRAPIGNQPQILKTGSSLRLAIAGDWGTGYWRGDQTPAKKVADQMRARSPDYTIHIGDTYYAGNSEQISENLARIWPQGSKGLQGNLAVPGNHEMYCGGQFYTRALPTSFPAQKQTSYFALRNDDWLVIALNTAYDATDMYLDGAISQSGGPQIAFLSRLLSDLGSRRIVVLSHHQPLNLAGDQLTALYGQIRQLFEAFGTAPDYWYWGHLHNAVVYDSSVLPCKGRCIGHGAIPYGVASSLQGKVPWYETRPADDSEYPQRVLNGFAMLEFAGPTLKETFYGEDGSARWTSD